MKNIYMVQASNTYTGNSFKAAYLPYAVGLLIAYAFTDENIKSQYEFKRFVFTREKTDEVVEEMDSPSVVGFSNYIWNTQYNLSLAQKIKDKYPECVIVFGGHNISPDNSFLEKYQFIDFLIHGEGEEAFRALLLELCKKERDFSAISNLSYRTENGGFMKNPTEVLTRTDYPSPYLTGLFDYIFEENPDMQLDAIIETSRGCPRDCAYCDWGCNSQRIKLFPIERVFAEIDWFAAHKVKFIWGADANFGAYERDMDIVDYFVKVREVTGYPERIRINYAMNKHKEVFEISRKLEKYGLSKEGATISFQSLNPETLANIGRRNMSLDKFSELISLYKKEGVTTYSELILGLPGETYESFCKGIGTLLAAGQHRLITVYNCELLPNSPMARPEYMDKFGIKTVTAEHLVAHTKEEAEIKEYTQYIVETNTLSKEDWIACNIFACFEESYHHHGILKYISIFLYKEYGVPYEEFYNNIIEFAKNNKDSVAYSVYRVLYDYFEAVAVGKPMKLYANEIYGDVTWIPKKMPHLDTIYRVDKFYEEITPILAGYGLSEEIIEELLKYEKTALKYPGRNDFSVDFDYNWHEYFTSILEDGYVPFKAGKNRVSVHNEFVADNWRDYAIQSTWFGKNGTTFNQGMTVEAE
ncbi:MAG: radical SAM protein [Ruminococcaceae bacterium]|nr:radical SAM protein [Oscillospiraceae bacterium]